MQREEGAYLSCLLLLKQKRRKKNTKENINAKKGGSLPFLSSSQAEKKKKKHKGKYKYEERKELIFLLPLLHLG
jgi:hypothetical protein